MASEKKAAKKVSSPEEPGAAYSDDIAMANDDKKEKMKITQEGEGEQADNKKDDNDDQKFNCKTELDIVFILDCTGSMAQYINSCKNNINSISSEINKVENADARFALVAYRDIPPQDRTFVTKTKDFTPLPFVIQSELSKLKATGGGDVPECLTSALYDAKNNLSWRDSSIKIMIVITDAPPHGLEKHMSDGFPDGDPDTFNKNNDNLNAIAIVQSIRDDLQCSIYSVACEPDISCNCDYARDFYEYLSECTDGQFMPLSNAQLLPKVIVGSVKQQIRLDQLTNKLEDEIIEIKKEFGDDISNDQLNSIIMQKWKAAGVKKQDVSIGKLYRKKRERDNIDLLLNEQKCKSLKDFKKYAVKLKRLTKNDFRHLEKTTKRYSDEDSESDCDEDSDDESCDSSSSSDEDCYEENDDNEEKKEENKKKKGSFFGFWGSKSKETKKDKKDKKEKKKKKKNKKIKKKRKKRNKELKKMEKENEMGFGGDIDDKARAPAVFESYDIDYEISNSGSEQRYYERSCSLSLEAVEVVMNKYKNKK